MAWLPRSCEREVVTPSSCPLLPSGLFKCETKINPIFNSNDIYNATIQRINSFDSNSPSSFLKALIRLSHIFESINQPLIKEFFGNL